MSNWKTLIAGARTGASWIAIAACASLAGCSAIGRAAIGRTAGGMLSATDTRGTERERLHEILDAASGTYIMRLIAERDSMIQRWPARRERPLRIWIDSTSVIDGNLAVFPSAVRGAFDAWSETGIPIRVSYTENPRQADIRVRWADHLARKTGSTTWRTDHQGWLVAGEITLATHMSDGHLLDARGMRAIALHEVGHALGLSHSVDTHDIMAPLVRGDTLSRADRETIRLLYSLEAGHVRQ